MHFACFISPQPGSRKWSVHEAEGSAQEELLIMGRELLELEGEELF